MRKPPPPPSEWSARRSGPSPSAGQPYPPNPAYIPSHLRYDWTHVPPPYDPYRAAYDPATAPIPKVRQKNSRRGIVIAGVVAAAMVGGGVGAATLLENERANDATAIKAPVAQASVQPQAQQPAGKAPAGSVEQVAAKVMPSVVKLQVDMGGQGATTWLTV